MLSMFAATDGMGMAEAGGLSGYQEYPLEYGGSFEPLSLRVGGVATAEDRWSWARAKLASRLQTGEAAIQVARTATGKPHLLPPHDAFGFSIAHRSDLVLLGVRPNGPIGVDLEIVDPVVDDRGIARNLFHPDEARFLAALPEANRVDAFYTAWTIKEAVLKALGRGITQGMAAPRLSSSALAKLVSAPRTPSLLHGRCVEAATGFLTVALPHRRAQADVRIAVAHLRDDGTDCYDDTALELAG